MKLLHDCFGLQGRTRSIRRRRRKNPETGEEGSGSAGRGTSRLLSAPQLSPKTLATPAQTYKVLCWPLSVQVVNAVHNRCTSPIYTRPGSMFSSPVPGPPVGSSRTVNIRKLISFMSISPNHLVSLHAVLCCSISCMYLGTSASVRLRLHRARSTPRVLAKPTSATTNSSPVPVVPKPNQ